MELIKNNLDTLLSNSECAIFMVDITKAESFSKVSELIPLVYEKMKANIDVGDVPLFFISNKIDLEIKREVRESIEKINIDNSKNEEKNKEKIVEENKEIVIASSGNKEEKINKVPENKINKEENFKNKMGVNAEKSAMVEEKRTYNQNSYNRQNNYNRNNNEQRQQNRGFNRNNDGKNYGNNNYRNNNNNNSINNGVNYQNNRNGNGQVRFQNNNGRYGNNTYGQRNNGLQKNDRRPLDEKGIDYIKKTKEKINKNKRKNTKD